MPFAPDEAELSKRMMAYWGHFASFWRMPEMDAPHGVGWPPFLPESEQVLVLDVPISVTRLEADRCALWDEIGYGLFDLHGRFEEAREAD